MSTRANLFEQAQEHRPFETVTKEKKGCVTESALWEPGRFAGEQLRRLVRQVFFPGWPRPARQVVFSAVDEQTDISEICMQVGQTLAAQAPGNTCVVEANGRLTDAISGPEVDQRNRTRENEGLRNSCRQISSHLWHVPGEGFYGESLTNHSAGWLRDRLAELRFEFDYTVLHGPPASTCGEAALLGHVSDGVVLVLEANSTRRLAAQRVKEMLQGTNVRLLGTVLSGRTFPIPQRIYRKL